MSQTLLVDAVASTSSAKYGLVYYCNSPTSFWCSKHNQIWEYDCLRCGDRMDPSIIVSVVVSLFLIMNPFSSIPTFLSIVGNADAKTINSYANKAVLVAGVLLFVFVFIGEPLMSIFGVTMESFRVAGGIILILMGVALVFGLKLNNAEDKNDAPWIIVATPIITGPGVITAVVLFSQQYSYPEVIISGVIAIVITWLLLRLSLPIVRLVGFNTLNIASRIIGLLLATLGVEYMLQGADQWMQLYWGM